MTFVQGKVVFVLKCGIKIIQSRGHTLMCGVDPNNHIYSFPV